MRPQYQFYNTALTALGIGCSLLAAMLIIEYTIVGDFKNILAYGAISFVIASIYLITMLISGYTLKRKHSSSRLRNHKLNSPS